MTSKNKSRGNQLERETVNLFTKYGHDSKRGYASNGLALGLTENVDVVVSKGTHKELRVQCKRRKKLASYLFNEMLNEQIGDFNCVVTRQERCKPLIVMDLDYFISRFYSGDNDEE